MGPPRRVAGAFLLLRSSPCLLPTLETHKEMVRGTAKGMARGLARGTVKATEKDRTVPVRPDSALGMTLAARESRHGAVEQELNTAA